MTPPCSSCFQASCLGSKAAAARLSQSSTCLAEIGINILHLPDSL